MVGQWSLLHDFEYSRASIAFVGHVVSVDGFVVRRSGRESSQTVSWKTV